MWQSKPTLVNIKIVGIYGWDQSTINLYICIYICVHLSTYPECFHLSIRIYLDIYTYYPMISMNKIDRIYLNNIPLYLNNYLDIIPIWIFNIYIYIYLSMNPPLGDSDPAFSHGGRPARLLPSGSWHPPDGRPRVQRP